MKCPENIANALLLILRIGLLRIRNSALAGRADRCAIEADHIHNIPELLRDFRPELLDFYWTTERSAYMGQSAAGEVAEYDAAWRALLAGMASSG